MRERAKEHHRDYAKKGEDSHMLKHWSEAHPVSARPSFNIYVVGAYTSCFDRQIKEAVRIQMRQNREKEGEKAAEEGNFPRRERSKLPMELSGGRRL